MAHQHQCTKCGRAWRCINTYCVGVAYCDHRICRSGR